MPETSPPSFDRATSCRLFCCEFLITKTISPVRIALMRKLKPTSLAFTLPKSMASTEECIDLLQVCVFSYNDHMVGMSIKCDYGGLSKGTRTNVIAKALRIIEENTGTNLIMNGCGEHYLLAMKIMD